MTTLTNSINQIARGVFHRKSRLLIASAVFCAIFAVGAAAVAPLAPDASDIPVKNITEQLEVPTLAAQMQAIEERGDEFIHEENIARGDSLASLLQRLGVEDDAADNFIKSDKTARQLIQQKAGNTVRAKTNVDGELKWLETVAIDHDKVAEIKKITIERLPGSDNFKATETTMPLERHIEMRTGNITSSLFAATDAAQIPDAVAGQLVDMFSTNVDFKSDLRRGDYFQIEYETFWQNGEMVSTGRLIAGEFHNAGHVYQAIWFDEGGSEGGYYGFDGKSIKKAFLKSPIAFTRISSGFAMRMHPISGQWKQHTGVDFAAPAGTPIRAAADGVIDVIGSSGGYGNLVVLRHWGSYSTAYGHMSRFAAGMHKGVKVKQGELIGYVGATGWATGPHLHYEFRVNNIAQDPMKMKVEPLRALNASNILRFRVAVSDVRHRFALLRPNEYATGMAVVL